MKLNNQDGFLLPHLVIYRCLVGRLIYLTTTWPCIVYVVNILNQFMHAPLIPHMTTTTRVLCYLNGNPNQGILFSYSINTQITTCTNFDWASYPSTSCFTTDYFIQLDNSLISWCTKKYTTIGCSSIETECHAMAVTTCKLTWLK